MTPKTAAERSAKTAAKRKEAGEEELRLRVRAGTKQALADLMAWAGIEEQGEATMRNLQAQVEAIDVACGGRK